MWKHGILQHHVTCHVTVTVTTHDEGMCSSKLTTWLFLMACVVNREGRG